MRHANNTGTAALIRDTIGEAMARLVFWGFYGLSTAIIVFFLFLLKIDIVEGARATVSLLGEGGGRTQELTQIVRTFHASVAAFLFTAGMALAVLASAGLIPTVFEAGRIELLVSKPVSRPRILLSRYMGNVLVVAVNVAYLVSGVWLIFGWRTGVWNPSFLLTIATTVFTFAVLLSVVVLVSVLSESAALATMVAFALMIMSPILAQHQTMVKLFSAEWVRDIWRGAYYVMPKIFDIGRINGDIIRGKPVETWMPIWSSAIFGAVVLAAGVYAFTRKDY